MEIIEPTAEWTFHDYRSALLESIIRKDKEREIDLVKRYLETEEAQGFYEKLRWQATQLYLNQMVNKEDNLERLITLQKESPDHSLINYYLARIYESYNDHNKASINYIIAAKYAINDEGKLRFYCNAAISLEKNNDEIGRDDALNNAKDLINIVDGGKIILLLAMRDIANIKNNFVNYTDFLEAILNENQGDHDNRFSLAYKYADLKENDLSLYHYKLLLDKRPNDFTWNNYGVSAYELNLKGKAINAFREAEKLGYTLAMGNIANKYIDTGFLNEAKEICNRALTMDNLSPMVNSALSKIDAIIRE